jgi:sugar phosphate isomerase/epimerase
MKKGIPLVSIGFDGYGLEDAVKGLSKTNSRSAILCCIDGFTKHVIPEETTKEEWARHGEILEKHGLEFYGLFGHCNLSDPGDIPKLRKRMEYTRRLGGGYIDTNAGPAGQEAGFFRNLPGIVELAKELDLTVCLETHGDMLVSGAAAATVFDKVKSDRVLLSYDPANVFFYTRGKVDPVTDIERVYERIGMIHFKGVAVSEDRTRWTFPAAREAVFDYGRFFDYLAKKRYRGMVAVELEGRFRFEEGKGFSIDPVWPQEKVVDLYNREIEYLETMLGRK